MVVFLVSLGIFLLFSIVIVFIFGIINFCQFFIFKFIICWFCYYVKVYYVKIGYVCQYKGRFNKGLVFEVKEKNKIKIIRSGCVLFI